MKRVLTTAPVLVLPDGSKPFTVYTGACGTGLGAVFDARGKGDMQEAVGTQLCLSIAYRPQTDGRTERVNRILEDLLRLCILNFVLEGHEKSTFHLWRSLITTVIKLVLGFLWTTMSITNLLVGFYG